MATFVERTQARAVRALLSLPPRVVRRLAGAPERNALAVELDPHAQLLARLQKLAQRPGYSEISVAAARAELALGVAVVEAAPPLGVRVEERMIDGAVGPLPARIYTPPDATGALPVLVFFHGGGFVVGSPAVYDAGCRTVAVEARCVVVSVDYRLAPEHRFPAAADDALAAFRWVVANTVSLGGDVMRVAVGGDSAGGNLAAVTALRARDEGGPRPVFQWLVYPATDMTRAMASHREHAAGPFLDGPTMAWFLDHYVPDPAQRTHPHASPLFAERHTGLPPACVVTAGFDPLRDEGDDYARKLSLAGNRVLHRCVPSLIHGFLNMTGAIPAADAAMKALHRDIREQLQ
jgi:acetyl esterase